ncbi:plastocyanin [Mesorhizobium soli]|nr:plastocyanin [Mesorhizobium soli]
MLSRKSLLITTFMTLIMSGAVQAETIQVTIKHHAFAPADIHAKVGDTIKWVNEDSVGHTVTAKGGWDLTLPPNKAASEVVKKAGEFNYHCSIHPSMKGHITVAAK